MHLRWFLFKIGMGDSKLYLANALTGMLVFFGCRNFWGIYLSVRFWQATSAALQTSQGQELLPPSMMLLFRWATRHCQLSSHETTAPLFAICQHVMVLCMCSAFVEAIMPH